MSQSASIEPNQVRVTFFKKIKPLALALGLFLGAFRLVATPACIVQWGNYVPDIPVTESNWSSLSVGAFYVIALKTDGTVTGWGDNSYGQLSFPTNLSGVAAIASGDFHNLAVLTNGTVIGWGDDSYGEATPPPGLTDVVAVAAGSSHSIALKRDGTVIGWGDDSFGQLPPPPDLSNVVAIAAAVNHSLALKSDGTVIAWGPDYAGEVDVPTNLNSVVSIAACDDRSFAIRADGSIVTWGRYAPIPDYATNLTTVAPTFNFSVGLRADGTTIAWGNLIEIDPFNGMSGVASVASGVNFTLAVTFAPPAPSNVRAAVLSTNQLEISWQDNSMTAEGFYVERGTNYPPQAWTRIATTAAHETNFVDTIPDSENYTYRVRAFNSYGVSAASPYITTGIIPGGPQSFSVTMEPVQGVLLDWYYAFSGANGFKIERAPDAAGAPGDWAQMTSLGTANVGDNQFLDTTIITNGTYWYRVRAYNDIGVSDYSSAIDVQVVPPNPPAIGYSADHNIFDFFWFEPGETPPVGGFKLERAPDQFGMPGPWTEIFNSADWNTYEDVTGPGNASLWYRVLAYNWAGDSLPSYEVLFNNGEPPQIYSLIITNNSALITWSDVGGHDYVQTANSSTGTYTNLSPLILKNDGATNYLDVGALTNSPTRFYRILHLP